VPQCGIYPAQLVATLGVLRSPGAAGDLVATFCSASTRVASHGDFYLRKGCRTSRETARSLANSLGARVRHQAMQTRTILLRLDVAVIGCLLQTVPECPCL
jgi:hypothetical protein